MLKPGGNWQDGRSESSIRKKVEEFGLKPRYGYGR